MAESARIFNSLDTLMSAGLNFYEVEFTRRLSLNLFKARRWVLPALGRPPQPTTRDLMEGDIGVRNLRLHSARFTEVP